jgi:hypothetical protein
MTKGTPGSQMNMVFYLGGILFHFCFKEGRIDIRKQPEKKKKKKERKQLEMANIYIN